MSRYHWKPTNKKVTFPQYDNFYYRREIIDSTGPYRYITDQNKWHPLTKCAQYIPGAGGPYLNETGWPQNHIDIDSDLRRQFRPLSKCPSHKYQPNAALKTKNKYFSTSGKIGSLVNCKDCKNCNLGLPCSCSHCKSHLDNIEHFGNYPLCKDQIIPEPARPFGKACNIPGAFYNNFIALCDDLQALDKIDSNQKIGLDSRNVTKDGFLDKDYKKIGKKAKLPNYGCFNQYKSLNNVMPSNY